MISLETKRTEQLLGLRASALIYHKKILLLCWKKITIFCKQKHHVPLLLAISISVMNVLRRKEMVTISSILPHWTPGKSIWDVHKYQLESSWGSSELIAVRCSCLLTIGDVNFLHFCPCILYDMTLGLLLIGSRFVFSFP